MFELFPGEEIITRSDNGTLTLSTHRICYESKNISRSYNQNIMLEHITSCENYYSRSILLLILCIISGILAIVASFNGQYEPISILLVISLIAGLLYKLTEKNIIIIASPSTKMKVPARRMKREVVLDFINKVEKAKNKRLSEVHSRQ